METVDGAWIGLVGTVVAGLIAGGVAVALQRRKEAIETAQTLEAKRIAAIALIGGVRSTAQEWATYLMIVTSDAYEGRFVELSEFDERSAELRRQVHEAMAAVGHLGPEDLFYSRFADTLRSIEAEVRSLVAYQSRDQALVVIRRTDSFGALFSMRRHVTTKMVDDVLNGHWIVTSG
ncbi:hypothetical protein ACFW9M_04535 [Streptomyces lydicus]|uniref:hypothetical protein n=1 Tax=Streptomyces lydicus TaxID=47763 RepID=UPI0036AD842F